MRSSGPRNESQKDIISPLDICPDPDNALFVRFGSVSAVPVPFFQVQGILPAFFSSLRSTLAAHLSCVHGGDACARRSPLETDPNPNNHKNNPMQPKTSRDFRRALKLSSFLPSPTQRLAALALPDDLSMPKGLRLSGRNMDCSLGWERD